MEAESRELRCPEPLDRLEPIRRVAQRGRPQPAQPSAAVVSPPGILEETPGPQQPEVPADRGTAHPQLARQFRRVPRSLGEQQYEAAPGCIPEEVEHLRIAQPGGANMINHTVNYMG